MSAVEIVDTYYYGALRFTLLKTVSPCAQHPTVTLNALPGTVILGRGVYVDWDGPCSAPSPPGNLLTAMYPNASGTTWTVASKDHIDSSPARIFAYCIVAQMKNGSPIFPGNYTVVSATSAVAAHPTQQADVPAGSLVVGGGAKVNWSGPGNMLFASYPTGSARTTFNRTRRR